MKYNELIIEENGKFEGQGIRKGSKLESRYDEVENKINNIILTPAHQIKHDQNS
jgi:hypothetical protein